MFARLRGLMPLTGRRPAPDLSTIHLRVPDLPAAFEGYRIALLADFHHPLGGDLAWLRSSVDALNATAPDMVALLGDYGESFKRARSLSRQWYHTALAELTPHLARLDAPDGLVALLGNHDYYAGAEKVRDWLSELGADVLVNRARSVCRGADVLRVAGLDDVFEGHPDPTVGCDLTAHYPTVVLSHNPDGILHLHPELRVDVVLAGHTHGGQIVLPLYGAPLTMAKVCGRRSASGWVRHPRTALYVTRGLGEQLPFPVRINCPRELVVLRLTAQA